MLAQWGVGDKCRIGMLFNQNHRWRVGWIGFAILPSIEANDRLAS